MSKFGGDDYILVIQSHSKDGEDGTKAGKAAITNAAMRYATAKKVPLSKRFSTRKAETTKPWPKALGGDVGKFSPLSPTSLSVLKKEDKLFVFAHSFVGGIAWMNDNDDHQGNAGLLAELLKEHGLKEVGLITFKSCQVGKGQFLAYFRDKLSAARISVGWLKGYRGYDDTEPPRADGTVHDIISRDLAQQDILQGSERYRIVRGPGGLFQGQSFGRYT